MDENAENKYQVLEKAISDLAALEQQMSTEKYDQSASLEPDLEIPGTEGL